MDDAPEQSKAPSKRRMNRVAAMQFLYACDVNAPETVERALFDFFENREHKREYYAFAEELASGAWEHRARIDEVIRQHAHNWTFERIAKVDLAILRLAIYELLYRQDIPPIVSINEAIDIAKDYSTDDSRRFVNGILDRLKDNLDRPLRKPAV